MTVLINERPITAELQTFIDQVVAEAQAAFSVFRETNTITANGTVGFIERVPGEELLVAVNYGGPWNHHSRSLARNLATASVRPAARDL